MWNSARQNLCPAEINQISDLTRYNIFPVSKHHSKAIHFDYKLSFSYHCEYIVQSTPQIER